MQQMTDTATAMGEAFDASKSDDYFYLPPEVFANPDFQKGLKLFLSPDGKAARLIITHDVNPASEEGISVVDDQLDAAHEAIKGTSLAGPTSTWPEPPPPTATSSPARSTTP